MSPSPALAGESSRALRLLATTAAAAITIVGLVYFFILRHTWKPVGAQFVADAVLHYAMPVLTVLFWARVPWLLLYPLVYLVYVFARGEVVGLYPYEFIDVIKIGYPAALRNSVALIVVYALVVGVYAGLKALMPVPGLSKGIR